MKSERLKFAHGPDAGKLAAGLWLFISPWILNYSQVRLPVWNGCAIAIIVAGFSIAAMLRFTKWEEWINIAAGFWLIASPLLLNYTALLGNHAALPAAANQLGVGLLIVILSLWELNLWEQAKILLSHKGGKPQGHPNS